MLLLFSGAFVLMSKNQYIIITHWSNNKVFNFYNVNCCAIFNLIIYLDALHELHSLHSKVTRLKGQLERCKYRVRFRWSSMKKYCIWGILFSNKLCWNLVNVKVWKSSPLTRLIDFTKCYLPALKESCDSIKMKNSWEFDSILYF